MQKSRNWVWQSGRVAVKEHMGKGKAQLWFARGACFCFGSHFFTNFLKDGRLMEATATVYLGPLPFKFTVWGLGKYVLALAEDLRSATEQIFLTYYLFGIKALLESCHCRRLSNYRTGQACILTHFLLFTSILNILGLEIPL